MFSKPNVKELNKKRYKCVDMHFHTNHSDGAATVNNVLEKIRKIGIGVAITDHNEISGVLEIFKKKKTTDFIIPAIEVKSKEKIDILFYFYDIKELEEFYAKEIKPYKKNFLVFSFTNIPLKTLISYAKKYNCVACVAHPYGYSFRLGYRQIFGKYEHLLKKVNVFEALNGGSIRKQNLKSFDNIKKFNKSFTAGSDGHSIYPLGNTVTYSKAKNVKEFLDNIKNKKNKVIGKEMVFGKFGEYFYYGLNKLNNLVK